MIAGGKAFANAAAPLKQQSVKHQLPTLVDDLNAAVAKLERAIQEQENARSERSSRVRSSTTRMRSAICSAASWKESALSEKSR
jgi:hypothetical protein